METFIKGANYLHEGNQWFEYSRWASSETCLVLSLFFLTCTGFSIAVW